MVFQAMACTLKDWSQILSYLAAVVVASVGVPKAIVEVRANRKQRADELRWKQASAAKELLDDIHKDDFARQAVHMLDWCEGAAAYEVPALGKVRIAYAEVLRALAEDEGENSAYIRDCFDWFFYRVDRIEHYIRRGLISFEDVKDVFVVYARQIHLHARIYADFLRFHEYQLATAFFARYSARKRSLSVRIWRLPRK